MVDEKYYEALKTIAEHCAEIFKDGDNIEVKCNRDGEIVVYQVKKRMIFKENLKKIVGTR